MKHRFLFGLLSLMLISLLSHAQTWHTVGTPGFSPASAQSSSIAIDKFGTPYVAFMDSANSYKATVMKFNGSSWVFVGSPGFSPGQASSTSLALDTNGIPYVAFTDEANGAKVSVMKYDGSSWVNIGPAGFSAFVSQYVSIAIDKQNTPYISYSDGPAFVMKFDGTNWVIVGTPGFSAGNTQYNHIALDTSGLPWVIYQDHFNGLAATVMKYNGTSWTTVGSPGFSLVAQTQYTTLAFAPDGTPYAAYTNGYEGPATVKKFNGTDWVSVGIPAGSSNWTNVCVDNTGTPYLAFQDIGHAHKSTVLKFNGVNWDTVGTSGFSAGNVWNLAMALDNSGNPYVIYNDIAASNRTTVMDFKNISAGVRVVNPESDYISVYPNPGNGVFKVSVSSSVNKVVGMIILNSSGETITGPNPLSIKTNTPESIKLSVAPGIYFITVLSGSEKLVSKIVIE